MKPLPKLEDDAAMILRGKRSILGAARNDAAETLRDQCTRIQGADWRDLPTHVHLLREAAERLLMLAAMWDELN